MEKWPTGPSEVFYADDSFEELIEDLPTLFEKYDKVECLKPLDDDDFWLIDDIKIPEWKTLTVNPTHISDLADYGELLNITWLEFRDDEWEMFDLQEYLRNKRVTNVYTDMLWQSLTDSGEIVDNDD